MVDREENCVVDILHFGDNCILSPRNRDVRDSIEVVDFVLYSRIEISRFPVPNMPVPIFGLADYSVASSHLDYQKS